MQQTISENQLIQIAQQENANYKQIRKVMRKVMKVAFETKTTVDALKEIQQNPQKTMVNLGSGILIEATFKDTKKCIRTIDGKIYKNDTIEEAIKKLEKRQKNAEEKAEKVRQTMTESATRLTEIEGIMRQIQAEKKKRISVK